MATLAPLPIYPSIQARKGFSPSQLAQFHSNLSDALARVVALPPVNRNTLSTRTFIASYAHDAAQQTLEILIWEDTDPVKHHDDRLRQGVLLLAEKLASSSPGLEPRTLLDLCVAFPSKCTRLRSILSAALGGAPDLPATFDSQVVPAFTSLLSPSRSPGLYGLRKTARCLTSLLRPSPPALVRQFAHSKEFLIALARAYDDGLTAISRSYGGIRVGGADRPLDHWEQIWLETKVDIVDAFHLLATTLIRDVSAASGAELAVEADRAFGIVFALLDVSPQSSAVGLVDAVPFLNRSLVVDYEYAYELSKRLSSALRHASRDDPRIELLESTLRALDVGHADGDTKDPGAFKLLLRSSGTAPGASNKTVQIQQPLPADKGKAKATVPASDPPPDADLESQVAQVLDILPNYSPKYIRRLLTDPSFPFRGDVQRVIGALFDGTAPEEDALDDVSQSIMIRVPAADAPTERRNVFDQENMDLTRIHVGKKTLDWTSSNPDREWMKAEILRRVEAMSQDSDEESGRAKALDVLDLDDDLDEADISTIKILGDEEDSDDDEVDPVKPETILELAYTRDPKLFNRDSATRRSKTRADLKQQTGWTDEQIEGWRIMLERNPKKERILQRHEFSGNRNVNIVIAGGAGDQPTNSSRGRGRGRSGGGGSGGGTRGGAGEKTEDVARERALKEKHKSSYRKRGHDKKMSKVGAGPSH